MKEIDFYTIQQWIDAISGLAIIAWSIYGIIKERKEGLLAKRRLWEEEQDGID